MLCLKCGKRPAVVFLSSGNINDTTPKGYCLMCAKDLGLKPVNDMLKNMGLGDEELENVQNQMDSVMSELGENCDMNELMKSLGEANMFADMDSNGDDCDDDNPSPFKAGGAAAFPNFLSNIFGGNNQPNEKTNKGGNNSDCETDKDKKKDKPNKNRKNINIYCEDLTRKAREGKLDRIIGRDKEIERVIQILSRRSKNNPCLIGEPGVGKTAIAEALALRIAEGNVPQRLKNKEIQLLDLTALIAGTQFRGQFESRIKGLTQEIKEAGNIILFIDEIHNLVGTSGDSDGSMNAANILKPALSRGELQVIGATTFNEYRKHIEKDSALERRFQPVKIGEPSIQDTIDVILGIKNYYENHHNVSVSDSIVRKIVVLSERYITDRFLPDKAIDLLDESCACASLRNKDREDFEKLTEQKQNLDLNREKLITAENVNYEQLANVQSELAQVEQKLSVYTPDKIITYLTEEDIANVIELWTGIPSSRIKEDELSKLSDLETQLKQKIIGQDEAVEAVSSAIKRSRVQISPRRRPASFIFVGPTGVGKTELVKVLSQALFDTPETLIRLDMSEYMEKHSVSKIIGSPPGYVGYDEAGQVTEKVRRRPYSVLLFDEIEKAHPDVLNILLQILDEGKVTDAQGRVVDFKNTVIIMTSNAGSERKENALGFEKTQEDATKERTMKALRDFLRPEFIARVDEIITFRNLKQTDLTQISELMLNEYVETLAEKGIRFTFDNSVCKVIAKQAEDGKCGARDLRNIIRKQVEDKITEEIINRGINSITGIHTAVNNSGEIYIQTI